MIKTVVIIQCRLSSTRLPAKAALDFCGKPLLHAVIDQCRMAKEPDRIIVATSRNTEDDIVSNLADAAGVPVFRGSLNDVRSRFIDCAQQHGATHFIRLTADNPFVEPSFIDELAALPRTMPHCAYAVHDLSKVVYGTASELVSLHALEAALPGLPATGEEHVTTGLLDHPSALVIAPDPILADPELSLTVDTFDQYVAASQIRLRFGCGPLALKDIVAAFRSEGSSALPFYGR